MSNCGSHSRKHSKPCHCNSCNPCKPCKPCKPIKSCDPCNPCKSYERKHPICDNEFYKMWVKYCEPGCGCDKCKYVMPTVSRNNCVDRDYRGKSQKLKCKLGKLQDKFCICPLKHTKDECKYNKYHGSFTKSLNHDSTTGHLVNTLDYKNMRDAIIENDQRKLALVPRAPGATMKLTNPLASLATNLIGAQACSYPMPEPPSLSSKTGAAEMVELYAKAYARDVPFVNFSSDPVITHVIDSTILNKNDVKTNLKYSPAGNGSFTSQNVFRGIGKDELYGPYISQLFLLDVPMGAGIFTQKYTTLKSRSNIGVGLRCEWGISPSETISIQNGIVSNIPGDFEPNKKFIFDGRSLAEAVHNDAAYQLFYQAVLVLMGMSASPNPGFPSYPNQSGFLTGFGGPNVLCALADAAGLALKAGWYWKWQIYRKLRPEAFGLFTSNVKTNTVSNTEYGIDDVLLQNDILNDIFTLYSGYTLPLCAPEGSPTHPSHPAGHACVAGACCTIIKIFFDAKKPWSSLPGYASGKLSHGIMNSPVEADVTGDNLQAYAGSDIANMTIEGEINKLASNVALGRDWAGWHFRTDGVDGMMLGEFIAMKYMEDLLASCVDNNLDGSVPEITFNKFDGTSATIRPATCNIKPKC